MPTLHLLGTGAAFTDAHRTTVMLAFEADHSVLAVDCGGDLVQRLQAAGLDLDRLDGLIITHEHPDHVSGFPLFMEKIWLAGRRRPLPVYGIAPALDQARRILGAFDTSGWDDMPEIEWHEIAHEPDAEVLRDDHWHVTASPVVHPKPNVGLRVEHVPTGRTLAYSCDTEPTDAVVKLARDVDVLVHEANGASKGHSSAEQAAEAGAEANAGRVLLVHLPPGMKDDDLTEARKWLSRVDLGEELGAYQF